MKQYILKTKRHGAIAILNVPPQLKIQELEQIIRTKIEMSFDYPTTISIGYAHIKNGVLSFNFITEEGVKDTAYLVKSEWNTIPKKTFKTEREERQYNLLKEVVTSPSEEVFQKVRQELNLL